MYELKDYLKKLIDEKGTNVYQLSKNSGLDRTTLQRTLKGERLPSYSFMETFCDYVNALPVQREEVKKLYEIKKLGRGVYENRLYIKDMLEKIATLNNKPSPFLSSKRNIEINHYNEQSPLIIEGNYNVQSAIRDIIEDELYNNENPSIKLTVPFNFHYLFELISHTCDSTDKHFEIDHIIELSKNPENIVDVNYNLKVITNVLPVAFFRYGNYNSHYYYGQVENAMSLQIPLPYYLLTSKFLIQVSHDYNTIIIHSDYSMHQFYNDCFDKQKNSCFNLLTPIKNGEELLITYTQNLKNFGRDFYTLEVQPCFGMYFTEDFIEKNLLKDVPNRDYVKTSACQFYNFIKSTKEHMTNLFTREGLEYFSQHGTIADVPIDYASPFSVEDRLFFLNKLKEDISQNKFNAKMVDPSKIIVSQNSIIHTYGSNVMIIVNIDENQSMIASLITETSIVTAFDDFFSSLIDSNFTYSNDETIAAIDEIIDKLSS